MKTWWALSVWRIKTEIIATYLALRDVRTPPKAKVIALISLVYLVSPIDLIPDAIPIIGLLDDLILVPLGMRFARNNVPERIMNDARLTARTYSRRANWILVAVVIFFAVWVTLVIALGVLLVRFLMAG